MCYPVETSSISSTSIITFYRHNLNISEHLLLFGNILWSSNLFNCQLDIIFTLFRFCFINFPNIDSTRCFLFYTKQSDAITKNFTAIRILISFLSLSHFVLLHFCSLSLFWTCMSRYFTYFGNWISCSLNYVILVRKSIGLNLDQ